MKYESIFLIGREEFTTRSRLEKYSRISKTRRNVDEEIVVMVMARSRSLRRGVPLPSLLSTKRYFERGVHDKELIMIGSLFVQGVVLLLLLIVTTVTHCSMAAPFTA